MICAWKQLLDILPVWLRPEVDRQGKSSLQELRLRIEKEPELIFGSKRSHIHRKISEEDLRHVIHSASRYSPWLASSTAEGYLTAPGGHRIGVCGEAVMQNGSMTGFRSLRSLNIRVARDLPGISRELIGLPGSLLIIGSPGSGKTTLLRDLIRGRSQLQQVGVVDERGELFPPCAAFDTGPGTDIITGCPKQNGIEMILRTMGPETIAVDEITASGDCDALISAGWCGVSLLATAHAADLKDLRSRNVYKPLISCGLFDTLVIMSRDKSFRVERMRL